ncbi:MAG: DUF192 domain-containing protein [Bacteroidetes bacterium]|nr:DUF192 domain-containing protein [Bacteroidota bacterium]
MSKSKKQSGKPVYRQKSLSMKLGIGFIMIAFLGYMIYSSFIAPKQNSQTGRTLKQSSIDFQKEGELTFRNAEGEFISKIDIELADDEESRSTGMMYRAKMDENQGMFFIFPYENFQSFWMRNTILPLDIMFVNSKLEIVTIHKNAKPFDENSYPSTSIAQYVVEVNGGYSDKVGIKEGDKIVWRKM